MERHHNIFMKGRLTAVNMSVLSKFLYNCSTIPINIPESL